MSKLLSFLTWLAAPVFIWAAGYLGYLIGVLQTTPHMPV